MAYFHHIQVTPLEDPRPCYWCEIHEAHVPAKHLVTYTSNLTNRRYHDPACERHAMPWRRAAWRHTLHAPSMPAVRRPAARRAYA